MQSIKISAPMVHQCLMSSFKRWQYRHPYWCRSSTSWLFNL